MKLLARLMLLVSVILLYNGGYIHAQDIEYDNMVNNILTKPDTVTVSSSPLDDLSTDAYTAFVQQKKMQRMIAEVKEEVKRTLDHMEDLFVEAELLTDEIRDVLRRLGRA